MPWEVCTVEEVELCRRCAVCVRPQGVGGHSPPLIIVCTVLPPLLHSSQRKQGGCMRSSDRRLHHGLFSSTVFCIVLSCQEVELMKIFGYSASLRNPCSGSENVQETGSEIWNINLANGNWIALRQKHCDIHILCFLIFYYRFFQINVHLHSNAGSLLSASYLYA